MSKVLVVGSEGNIGVPLVKHLRSIGYQVMETDIRPAWRDDYLMADINFPIDLLPAFDWKPDVVFIEFAINDAVTRFDLSLDTIRRNVDTLLDRIATALPTCEVILQIMNPAFGKAEGESAHRRNQDAYQQIYRDAAKRRGLLLVDHSVAWNHLLATEGEAAVKKLIPEGVHPNVEGWRRLVTPTLHRALDLAPPP